MRRNIFSLLLVILVFLSSCYHDKEFVTSTGKKIHAHPYGWADKDEHKIPGVKYKACVGNIVWSVIFIETIGVPIWLTGWRIMEPVSYEEPK